MYKCKVNGWVWHLRDEHALDSWFNNYEELLETNCVKSNAVRSVFTVDNYFVKYDSPVSCIKIIRSFFFPKVKKEFDVGVMLEKLGIPVVKYLGWGKRGGSGFLLTEAYKNAMCARDYWFSEVVYSNRLDGSEFTKELMALVNKLILAGIYHGDFHLGNILIDSKTGKMALVDVYGVRQYKKLSERQIIRLLRIVVLLRDKLSDDECVELLNMVFRDKDKSKLLWTEYLDNERVLVNKLWKKRCHQIENINGKYCTKCSFEKKTVLLKHDQMRIPVVSIDELSSSEDISKVEYDYSSAHDIWLKSFKLQFHCIRHKRPVAWEVDKSGHNFLYFEKLNLEECIEQKAIENFVYRCSIAGVTVSDVSIIKKDKNGLYISDIDGITIN